jgi:hypothetical protein
MSRQKTDEEINREGVEALLGFFIIGVLYWYFSCTLVPYYFH